MLRLGLRRGRILIKIGTPHQLPGSQKQQPVGQGQGKEINHRNSRLAGSS